MVISKFKFKLALTLTLIMFLFGSIYVSPMSVMAKSSTGNTASKLTDKDALKKLTSKYVSQFKKGNFNDFYKNSTKQMQQAISIERLKQGWNILVSITGAPGKSIGSTYTQKNSMHLVTEKIECTLYNITVTIGYNTKGKPDYIWSSYVPKDPPKPQSTSSWEEFSTTVGEKNLNGILTLPKGVEKPPVVIMIQGSGPSDMNESVGATPNRPFEDIAHGLADQGVATLRYNKCTYQYPGVGGDSIEYEILNDAAAAVNMLSKDNRVDPARIFLLGHSLGGMMAPKITTDNTEIKGFISMAGSLRSLQEILFDQYKAAFDAEPSLTEQQKNVLLAQVEAEIEKTKKIDENGNNIILDAPTSYWKSLSAIDNIALVKKLTVPMLILQGSADFQVYTDTDYKLWQTTLMDHTNVTYHLYDGLSHEFMPNQLSKNGAPDITVYNAPNHVDPQVITDIAVWVKGQ